MWRKREILTTIVIFFTVLLTIVGSLLSNAVTLPLSIKNLAWPLIGIVTVLLFGLARWQSQKPKDREEIAHALEIQNRQRMLTKMRTVLEQSFEQPFPQAPLIDLRLREQQNPIANPQQHVLGLPDQPTQELPADTRISQVYTKAGGELLILGKPGSGKTMLLLELTRALLESAERDKTKPIPVVFNLSSWKVKQHLLTDWLIEELYTKYRVPRPLGQSWVDDNQLVLVLDGLDETHNVPACVNAINKYRQDHGLVSIVICSRSDEYLNQENRVSLHKVVIIQPLTLEQVNAYLGNFGESGEAIHVMLHSNLQLQELVISPLMLNVLIQTYSDLSLKDLPEIALPSTQQQILAGYVERMLQRRKTTSGYTQQQTMHWLIWLASQLHLHNQTEFYLERIQPDWLPEEWLRSVYYALVCSTVGLIFGLVFWFIAWLAFGLAVGLAVGLVGALVGGLSIRFTFIIKREIQPVEIRSLSWVRMRRKLPLIISTGMVGGMVGWLGAVPYGDQYGLPGGLLFGLVGALISAWLSGVSRNTLDKRKSNTPNEGIRRSARYSGFVWLLGALGIWLGGLLVSKLGGAPFGGNELGDGLLHVFVGGLIIGLVGALYAGGLVCIQHFILRLILWLAGYTPSPWSYLLFLDYTVTCILLRKEGSDYIFIHSLLLEYLGKAKTKLIDFHVSRRTFVISLLGSLALGGGVGWIIGNRSASQTSAQILLPKAWWYPTSNMLLARGSFHATRLQHGMILVQGGSTSTSSTDESELFDPKRGIWTTTKGRLNEKRSQHTATLLPNGKVLVTGGYTGSNGLDSAELYDPATDMWALTKQRMRQARTRHTATLLPNGKVLIVGGVEGLPVGGQPLASAELYDLATDTWSLASEMHSQRADHVAVLMSNGNVLVAGGTLVNDGQTITATAEFYNPSSNTWTFVEKMHMPRAYFTAVPLPSEKVLVIGGRIINFDFTPTAEIYDHNTKRWSTTNNMQYARQNPLGQIALTLEDGSILVAGGDDLGTSEIYSPSTRTWASLLNLDFSHRGGATVLLEEGRALVVGGTDTRGKISSSSSAEIYAPS